MSEARIANQLAQIALAIDRADEAALSSFWTDKAQMILIAADGTEYLRPAPLARTLAKAATKYADLLRHVVVAPAVELLDERSARSHSYTLYVAISTGQVLAASETEDDWVRTAGTWKIEHRRVRMLGELPTP